MNERRELELKYRLETREDYLLLLRASDLGKKTPDRLQINDYFDSGDMRLLGAGAMLRLRRDRGAVLTFKQGGERQGVLGLFDAVEVEETVSPDLVEEILQRPRALIDMAFAPCLHVRRAFGRLELEHSGWLENHRCCVHSRFVLEIDRLVFPGGEEGYEVEIETYDPEAARSWFEGELRRLGVRAAPQRQTKLELLLERSRRSPAAIQNPDRATGKELRT